MFTSQFKDDYDYDYDDAINDFEKSYGWEILDRHFKWFLVELFHAV